MGLCGVFSGNRPVSSTYVVQWYSVAGGLASALHVSFTSVRCRYQLPSKPSMVTSGSSVRQGRMLEEGEVRGTPRRGTEGSVKEGGW